MCQIFEIRNRSHTNFEIVYYQECENLTYYKQYKEYKMCVYYVYFNTMYTCWISFYLLELSNV